MNIEEIVRARHSVREFSDQKIEGEVLQSLKDEAIACQNESGLRFEVITNEENAFGKSKYGNFKNCRNYIVIIGDKREVILDERAGYFGEKLVLKAQELGLNSCWVALTFNKNYVPCEMEKHEKIIIVIAIGYGKSNGTEHKSKSFSEVSKTTDVPEWYKQGVEFALLAPTALNQQKFRFILKDDNKVLLKAGLGVYTKLDLGIVKYHFELGAGTENFEWV